MDEDPSQKGKAKSQNADATNKEVDTFSQRLQTSASGLVRDTVFGARSNDASSTLSHAIAAQSKGESSTALRAYSFDSSNRETSSLSSVSSSGKFQSEAFRSSPGSQSSMEFEPHFEQGESVLRDDHFPQKELSGLRRTWDTQSPGGTLPNTPDFEGVWTSAASNRDIPSSHMSPHADGAAVVDLLSDPSFQPDFWSDNAAEEANEQPYTISADDMVLAENFKSILPESMSTGGQRHHQALNQAPMSVGGPKNSNLVKAATAPYTEESYYYLEGDSRAPKLGQQEAVTRMETFFDEIENYHQEVWGYIQPQVEAARKEVLERKSQGDVDITGGPAVRRLGMILGHLEGSRRSSATDALSELLTGLP